MKRIVFSLLWIGITLAAFGQPNVLRITGQVTDDSTGAPIPFQPVLIKGDSSTTNCPNGMVYSQIVMTNPMGVFLKQIPIFPNSPAQYTVSTKDCNNAVHSAVVLAVAGTDTVNFSICNPGNIPPPPPPCNAGFTVKQFPNMPGKVKFISNSTPIVAMHAWDFGDGNTSTLRHPLHVYSAPGTYSACLVISVNGGLCTDTFCMNVLVDTLSPPPPPPCQAGFTAKQFPNIPGRVKFVSTSAPLMAMHNWDFGDGNTSNLKHPMHNYSTPGNYNVCLVISNNLGTCNDTFCMNVLVDTAFTPPTIPCQASFIAKQFPFMPGKVKFVSTSAPLFAQHSWDFGDGGTSLLKHPMHIYANPGLYNVCLAITSANGLCTDTFCYDVLIDTFNTPSPVPCVASFNYVIDSVTGAVHFTDQSTPVFHYAHWDFGDGSTSILKNPVHAYQSAGSYTVRLAIGCMHPANTCVDTTTQVIVIPSAKKLQLPSNTPTSPLGYVGQVYPNPSKGDVSLDLEVIKPGKVVLQVLDLAGKQVYESTSLLKQGNHTLVIPSLRLSTGYYTLRLHHESGEIAIRKWSRIE